MCKPTVFKLDQLDWVDERSQPNRAPEAVLAEAERMGARRKHLARGQSGYYSEYTTMPPGFVVPGHRHDHDELFILLTGSCTLTMGDETVELSARDSAALSAGVEYGFTVGPAGIEFMVVRPGAARADFD
ncbi:cupin domain-containing protein [Myxococcota bacterium]|nr:cupin domain-containing protein [Myxococcota bacterium]